MIKECEWVTVQNMAYTAKNKTSSLYLSGLMNIYEEFSFKQIICLCSIDVACNNEKK